MSLIGGEYLWLKGQSWEVVQILNLTDRFCACMSNCDI